MTWDFHKQFINGEWVPSTGEGRIKVVNPATLEAFEWVPDGTYEAAARVRLPQRARQRPAGPQRRAPDASSS